MRSPPAQRPDASWGTRIIALILENPGDAIYGAIAVGALLAAETPRRETYAKTVAAVIITLLLYWGDSYADLAGERLRSGARLTARGLLATMLRELPILIGAAIPLATLLICWIAGTGLSAAVLAAVWTSAGIVLAIELAAGLRGRLRGQQLLSQAFVGALLGSSHPPQGGAPLSPSAGAGGRPRPRPPGSTATSSAPHTTPHTARSPDRASPGYQPSVPGGPLNGPIRSEVIQPP